MKRSVLWMVALLPLLAGLGGMQPVQADDQAVRKELQGWYEKMVDTYRNEDLRAHMALLTPDYKMRDFKGKIFSRKAWEGWTGNDIAATGEIHSAGWNIKKLTVKGPEATVLSTDTWKSNFTDLKGEFGPKGKVYYDLVWSATLERRFLKTPHGWLCRGMRGITPDSYTYGGKPLVPLAARKKK